VKTYLKDIPSVTCHTGSRSVICYPSEVNVSAAGLFIPAHPRAMKGGVDLSDWLHLPSWLTC